MTNVTRLSILLLVLLLSSCASNIYRPSAVYTPQLKDKNEAHVAGSGGMVTGFQLDAAWAPTRQFHLQAQGNISGKYSGNVLGGIGYRKVFLLKGDENFFTATFTAGYSGGMHERISYPLLSAQRPGGEPRPGFVKVDMEARWHGAFIQYTFGISVKGFCLYGGARTQWLSCSAFRYETQVFDLDTTGGTVQYPPGLRQHIDPLNRSTTITDMFVGATFGKKQLQLFFQIQFRYQSAGRNLNEDLSQYGDFREGVVGLQYRFGRK